MHSAVRVLVAIGVAAASLTCADQTVSGVRRGGLAQLAIAPVFEQAPSGGPRIDIDKIKGVLRKKNGTDSAVAEAPVVGDSAVLEFTNVTVTGDSTTYDLAVRAYDKNNVLVFQGSQDVRVKPGENKPAAPALTYSAPDATVESIDISVASLQLDWAGAKQGDQSCLNRAALTTAKTEQKLTVAGKNAANQDVSAVRVGWTSRDTSVATVDTSGLVKSRCSNKSTYEVARTFLDKVDSIKVSVTAPPFSLLMQPDSISLPRRDTAQLTAIVVDENNNAVATSDVTWRSSDSSRATVSSTGRVIGIFNGRVIITASAGSRRTVGVVQVVRPRAAKVQVAPKTDVLNVGQHRVYAVTAFDRNNDRIPDASGFAWRSTDVSVVQVSSAGNVAGMSVGDAKVIVSLDDKADTASVSVTNATTGAVRARVLDAATGLAIAGATVAQASNTANAATTGSDGSFTLGGLTSGNDIVVGMTGYVTVTQFNLQIVLGQTVQLGDIPMAPTGGTGTLTGKVVNALNDAGVSGAIVKLFSGINPRAADPSSGVTTPAAVMETTTGTDGTFSLAAVPAGTYTYAVGGSGFSVARSVTVAISGSTRDTRIVLSPVIASGSGLRIVLTWGNCSDASVPCDLDSHLTGPRSAPDTGRFHVAFFNDFYLVGSDTVAVLDNDALSGLGPETITLRPKASGVYKYYVHNYTDASDTTSARLATTSRARVDVYQGSNLVATFFPPQGQTGTLWAVFQYDGSSIQPVGQMIRVQDFNEAPADFLRVGEPTRVDGDAAQLVIDWRRHSKIRK